MAQGASVLALSAESALRAVMPPLHACLLLLVWRGGLLGKYKAFGAYLAFSAIRGAVLSVAPIGRSVYGWIYLSTEPALWILYGLVVLELYSLALKHYRGIASLGRWTVTGAAAGAALVSLLSLAPDLDATHPYPIIHLSTVIGRAICSSLALFLLLMTFFVVIFPIRLSRNAIVHTIIYSIYFLGLTAAYFVHNIFGPEVVVGVNVALGLTTVASLVGWMLLLSPQGEQVIVPNRRHWEPEDEERLLKSLDSINATLMRVARK